MNVFSNAARQGAKTRSFLRIDSWGSEEDGECQPAKVSGDIAGEADVCSSRSEEEWPAGVGAKAGFPILGGSSPRSWPRPGSGYLLLFEEKLRRKGEFGDEVGPGRPLEQVASGSFHVINHKPRVAGMRP